MNSTKWSRPAQQSESAYLQAALRVLRSTHTHTHIWACMHTNTQSKECQFQFLLHSQEEDESCVCVRRLCRMSEVIEMLHILSCTGGIIGPCSLMDTLFLPLPSISLPHIQLQTLRQIGAPICVCVCVCFYYLFCGDVCFCNHPMRRTPTFEHQNARIKETITF